MIAAIAVIKYLGQITDRFFEIANATCSNPHQRAFAALFRSRQSENSRS